ncbi:ribosomal RNA small subunit methyltransferase A [Pedobacter sp.]|nr:ribosomal RNA small subunit methyltransferase A [Candidatus Saccharibacteria bacterium]
MKNNKSLGQHWLKDRFILEDIADCAELNETDTVLEIGPGLGTLTSVLLRRAGHVVAVEFDEELAEKLPAQFPGTSLEVVRQDILAFDLSVLPKNYKVVANVPYYITSKIVQLLSESKNPPSLTVMLVQKEVAQRLAATPGSMSIMSVAAQVYAEATLGPVVLAEHFIPPPQVNSQVVVLKRREIPLYGDTNEKEFFRIVKAGYSERRKKLRSSLAGGLGVEKTVIDAALVACQLAPDVRAQELSIDNWVSLVRQLQ